METKNSWMRVMEKPIDTELLIAYLAINESTLWLDNSNYKSSIFYAFICSSKIY